VRRWNRRKGGNIHVDNGMEIILTQIIDWRKSEDGGMERRKKRIYR